MKRPDVRLAWREKLALFKLFTLASCTLLFFIIGIPRLVCPPTNLKSLYDVESMNKYDLGKGHLDKAYVAAYGRYYEITDLVDEHINEIGADDTRMQRVLGRDVSQMFFPAMDWDGSCPGITNPGASWDNLIERDPDRMRPHQQLNPQTQQPMNFMNHLGRYSRGRIGWTKSALESLNNPMMKVLVMYNKVYNVAGYFQGQMEPGFFDRNIWNIFTNAANGQDVTGFLEQLRSQNPVYYRNVVNCMDNLFYIGVVDGRDALKCTITDTIMLAASVIICLVIGIKFLSAFTSGDSTDPDDIHRYVMIQIPCYTENRESLEATLNSIANARYSDQHKLAVIICDGIITGMDNGGTSKPTPDIVLDILYGNEERATEEKEKARHPMSYYAVGEGRKAENKAQLYSGKYTPEGSGRELPFVVIVKTGVEGEKMKRGNRGKRDSQCLLFRFLSNVYGNQPLTEFEYALYHEVEEVINVPIRNYEFMLMVDADTSITELSLTKLVHHMTKDKKTIGLSGETLVKNENESWAARIQVYEYFISHHLAKAFESLFGSVTCLPGCFCMYRIRNSKGDPILISPRLIGEYGESQVNTLHKKNLLHLGEDRFLTTLILKHFRGKKTRYTSDAQCYTNVPETFSVLVSQRRRWINSTIHNLLELVNLQQLCGFCCFSMRFVVFLDLISTIVAPAAVGYVGWLLYVILYSHFSGETQAQVYMVSLIMIAAIYGLQLVIIIVKMKWAFVIYMLFYVIAMPYFSAYLPLYAFWHMDDFKWGNTRMVLDEGKDDEMLEPFDPSSIVRKSIKQWEVEFKEHQNHDDDEIAFKDCAGSGRLIRVNVDANSLSSNHQQPTPIMPPIYTPSQYAPSQYVPSQYAPSQYAPSQYAPSQYAPSQYAPSQYAPSQYAPSPHCSTLPQHIANYVGHTYPVPSSYAPSSFGDHSVNAENVERRKKERKKKRRQRHLKTEDKEKRKNRSTNGENNTSINTTQLDGEKQYQTNETTEAGGAIDNQQMTNINLELPVLEKDSDWGVLLSTTSDKM
jgi:chitin synthase